MPPETPTPQPEAGAAPRVVPTRSPGSAVVGVDRILCTGHGVCGHLLPEAIRLDADGYPILLGVHVDRRDADVATRLCPARALYRES